MPPVNKPWAEILTQDKFSGEDIFQAQNYETCALGEIANLRERLDIGVYGAISTLEIRQHFGEEIKRLAVNFYEAILYGDAENAREIYAELKVEVQKKLAEVAA